MNRCWRETVVRAQTACSDETRNENGQSVVRL
jgi:hypothetical protein